MFVPLGFLCHDVVTTKEKDLSWFMFSTNLAHTRGESMAVHSQPGGMAEGLWFYFTPAAAHRMGHPHSR